MGDAPPGVVLTALSVGKGDEPSLYIVANTRGG